MNARQERELLNRTAVMEDKIDNLSGKVDHLTGLMDRGLGAWLFVKILGSTAIGVTIVWAFIAQHFHR